MVAEACRETETYKRDIWRILTLGQFPISMDIADLLIKKFNEEIREIGVVEVGKKNPLTPAL